MLYSFHCPNMHKMQALSDPMALKFFQGIFVSLNALSIKLNILIPVANPSQMAMLRSSEFTVPDSWSKEGTSGYCLESESLLPSVDIENGLDYM